MQSKLFLSVRCAGLLAGAALALTSASAVVPTDAFPKFESYIKISGQAPSVSGNESSFQRRLQQNANGGLGIEALHYTRDLSKDTSLQIDGRALYGAEDYLAKFKVTKAEVGSLEAGYKTFRTFYDGIGGFFPVSGQWNSLNPADLHVDRGEFWIKALLERPNAPVFEFSFKDGTRTGKKDSLIWGDSDFTGLPNNTPPISQVRKMVPSYRKLDEHHQDFDLTMRHTAGNTNLSVTLLHETTDDNSTRYGVRFPGEVRLFPAPASTVLLPAAQMNNEVRYSQTDGMETKMSGITIKVDTKLSEKVKVLAGANYQDLSSTFTGDRPLYTTTPTAVGVVIVPSNNFLNLLGGSDMEIYTGTLAVELKPVPTLLAKLGLRGEDKRVQSAGELTNVAGAVSTTTGVVTITSTRQVFWSRIKETSLTPQLDLSYTGFKTVTLYASGSKQLLNGDERYTTAYNPLTAANGTLAQNDMDDDHEKLNLGFNWSRSSRLTVRGEIFRKHHINRSIGYDIGLGDSYVLGYQFEGVKGTIILKPVAQWSLTGRYVYQKGTADVAGNQPTYPTYESMDAENHMLGTTIDWNPNQQFYAQANVNVVYSVLRTLNGRGGVAVGTGTNLSYSADTVLGNSNNNYVNGSLIAGAVVTKADDLQFRVNYYKADNYNPQVARLSMPFGAGAREISATVGVKHKFSKRLLGDAKIGYIDNKSDTTGGHTNFKGPLVYFSLEYAL